jgi:hypothetical protein
MGAVKLLGGRRHLGLRELPDGSPEQFGLIVKSKVHGRATIANLRSKFE